jgi:hypothetical protein
MKMENMEIANAEVTEIASGNTNYGFAASYDLSTEEGQIAAFNAGVASDYKLSDFAGKTIVMTAWLVEPIEAVNQLTGELENRPHIVITDADGATYEAQSVGLYQALQRLKAIRPVIDDDNPATIEIINRKVRLGSMLTFKLIG